jgi:hypothetical protein
MASSWSEPFFGASAPTRAITVGQFRDYQERVETSKAAGSVVSRGDSFHTGDSVMFTLDRELPAAEQLWLDGMFTGLTTVKGVVQATIVTPDAVEWFVPTDKGSLKKPASADAEPSGKRSHKEIATPPKDKRTVTRPRLGQLAEMDKMKAIEFVKASEKCVAFLRACVHPSSHSRLNQNSAFRLAEQDGDVLSAYCEIADLALFSFQSKEDFATSLRRDIESQPEYKLDLSRDNFPDFSAKYLVAFRLLCYSDPTTTHGYMVNTMTSNLPLSAPYGKIKRDLLSKDWVNQQTDDAKKNLNALVCLITSEIHIHNAMHRIGAATQPQVSMMTPRQNALVMALEAKIASLGDKYGKPAGRVTDDRPLDVTILEACRAFSRERGCRYKERCRYGHFTETAKDPRVTKGVLTHEARRTITASVNKKPAETILTLKAEAQALRSEAQSLRSKLAELEF